MDANFAPIHDITQCSLLVTATKEKMQREACSNDPDLRRLVTLCNTLDVLSTTLSTANQQWATDDLKDSKLPEELIPYHQLEPEPGEESGYEDGSLYEYLGPEPSAFDRTGSVYNTAFYAASLPPAYDESEYHSPSTTVQSVEVLPERSDCCDDDDEDDSLDAGIYTATTASAPTTKQRRFTARFRKKRPAIKFGSSKKGGVKLLRLPLPRLPSQMRLRPL